MSVIQNPKQPIGRSRDGRASPLLPAEDLLLRRTETGSQFLLREVELLAQISKFGAVQYARATDQPTCCRSMQSFHVIDSDGFAIRRFVNLIAVCKPDLVQSARLVMKALRSRQRWL